MSMQKKSLSINIAHNACDSRDIESCFYSCIRGAMRTTTWCKEDSDLARKIPILVKLLLDPWLSTSKPGTFLELGCGHGTFASLVIDMLTHYTGYDIWPDALRYAAEESLAGRNDATLWHGDGRTFKEIPDASQDFVFSYQTLGHVPTVDIIEGYILETIRVLSERGVARLHIKGPNMAKGIHMGWRPLGSLPEQACASDSIKRRLLAPIVKLLQTCLPPHFLVPQLMKSPPPHPEWLTGATLSPNKAIKMVREAGWCAEVMPCAQTLPTKRNVWDAYWLVIYKNEPPAFIRYC